MYLLENLAQKYKRISIVGMAKNAGKTTALNYLLEEAMDEGLRLGVTSTGRDGEGTDVVTGTDKPRVFLDTDTIVSVPTQLYELADAGLDKKKIFSHYDDCGTMLYSKEQDVHGGGSGCGCSASVFAGKLLKDMEQGKYRRILLMSTGALLSTISPFQGESIPGIAHAAALEVE